VEPVEADSFVYALWHIYELNEGEDESKLCGIFSTKAAALEAQATLTTQPGFRLHPDAFSIAKTLLNKPEWVEGFSTALPGAAWQHDPEPTVLPRDPSESECIT